MVWFIWRFFRWDVPALILRIIWVWIGIGVILVWSTIGFIELIGNSIFLIRDLMIVAQVVWIKLIAGVMRRMVIFGDLLLVCWMIELALLDLLAEVMPGVHEFLDKELFFLGGVKGEEQVNLELVLILVVLHDSVVVQ